jgi:hypothetical protein
MGILPICLKAILALRTVFFTGRVRVKHTGETPVLRLSHDPKEDTAVKHPKQNLRHPIP